MYTDSTYICTRVFNDNRWVKAPPMMHMIRGRQFTVMHARFICACCDKTVNIAHFFFNKDVPGGEIKWLNSGENVRFLTMPLNTPIEFRRESILPNGNAHVLKTLKHAYDSDEICSPFLKCLNEYVRQSSCFHILKRNTLRSKRSAHRMALLHVLYRLYVNEEGIRMQIAIMADLW